MANHFNKLTEEQQESLVLLAEESGEVVQRVTKILRFGLLTNPYTSEENAKALARELGDVMAAMEIAYQQGILDPAWVLSSFMDKMAALRAENDRLCHIKVR